MIRKNTKLVKKANTVKKGGITKTLILLLAMLMVICACSGCGASSETLSEDELWEIVADAYTFAFPLVILDATATNATNTVENTGSNAPVNQIAHASDLVDASFRDIVTPNVDTVYSQCYLDLGDGPQVLFKPETERFCSVEIMDAYTNCVAVLGSGSSKDSKGESEGTWLLVKKGYDGEIPEGVEAVEIPTDNAFLLFRTLVDGKADLPNVRDIQNAMWIRPLEAYLSGGEYTYPKGTYDEKNSFIPVEKTMSMGVQEFFDRANALMVTNPPAEADEDMVARIAAINVGPGMSFDASVLGDRAEEKWSEMTQEIQEKWMQDKERFTVAYGCWDYSGYPIAEFGTEYAYRAIVAKGALGANPVDVAIYPMAYTDDDGNALSGADDYVVHFKSGGLPPMAEGGFWSITAYNEKDALIDNDLDRYAINDRSGFKFNEDGSLDILVQVAPPEDGSMNANWLPVGDEPFHLCLRVYLPLKQVLDGEWEMPLIQKR